MPHPQRPNILVFMSDHQRADTVLAEHPCRTPRLDVFARQGIRFTQAFCPSPHCCPSRATFMTGLYPSRHGVWNNVCNATALSRGVPPAIPQWSQALAQAGYDLAYAGKWHVSAEEGPAARGWREIFVSGHRKAEHDTTWQRYAAVAAAPEPARRGEGEILRPGYGTYRAYANTGAELPRHDEEAVARALDEIPRLAAGEAPWALFVGVTSPHDPYNAPGSYLDLYRPDEIALPPNHADDLADKPRIYRRMREMRWGQLTPRETREAMRHYYALCSYLDAQFGRLLDALEKTGQARRTLVLYCADHGDYCGEHGLFAKGIPCFRGAYHVPAVLRWPDGVARPGRAEQSFVSLADFAPTFVELAGAPPLPATTGRSLVPFLRADTPACWRDEMHTQCNGVELLYTQRSVMTRDWKYVFNGFDDDELYDLRADPLELRNVVRDPAHAGIVREMCRRLWRFARRENDAAIQNYITVSLAPWGPAEALRAEGF
jgi:arylsulfatase A-like enzyme